MTLHNPKSFPLFHLVQVVRKMWAKYLKTKLVQAVSEWKKEMKDSLLHAHVVVKTSNLTISRPRFAEDRKNIAQMCAALAARFLMFF